MSSPGSTSSLPVEITTIMGWALTRRRAMPAPAAMATSGADSRVPAANSSDALRAVGAAAMHVLPGLHGLAPDLGDLAVALHLFDGHHGIAAARQHRARHDFDAGPASGERLRRIAGGLRAADAQAPGVVAAAAVDSAMPSMATRSNGGWSRSA